MTIEEKFIIKLFEKASALGDPKYPVEAATVIEGLHPQTAQNHCPSSRCRELRPPRRERTPLPH